MSLFFTTTEIEKIIYNDTELDKVYFNDTLIFEKKAEIWYGQINGDASSARKSHWTSKTDDSIETGNIFCAQNPTNLEYAVFKVDTSKYKYMDITDRNWNYSNFLIYSSLKPSVSKENIAEKTVSLGSSTGPVSGIDLSPYNGKYIGFHFSGTAGTKYYVKLNLHN